MVNLFKKLSIQIICALVVTTIFPINQAISAESAISLMCPGRGGYSENVCQVSMYALIASPEKYDNKLVLIIGYFADGEYPLLFVSKDFYEISSIPDAIALAISDIKPELRKRLFELEHGYVGVVGRFKMKGTLTSEVTGHRTSGTITELREILKDPRLPWGYARPMPSLVRDPQDKITPPSNK